MKTSTIIIASVVLTLCIHLSNRLSTNNAPRKTSIEFPSLLLFSPSNNIDIHHQHHHHHQYHHKGDPGLESRIKLYISESMKITQSMNGGIGRGIPRDRLEQNDTCLSSISNITLSVDWCVKKHESLFNQLIPRWELEDYCFEYIGRDEYYLVVEQMEQTREEREEILVKMKEALLWVSDKVLSEEIDIEARPKHIYSMWSKMKRKNHPLDQIHDQYGIRFIVPTIQQCYDLLDAIHAYYGHLPGEFDDYIKNPKESGYQSLHTIINFNCINVTTDAGDGSTRQECDTSRQPLYAEVQIRTKDMHYFATYGPASHQNYKLATKNCNYNFEYL
ncbi:RelA [Cavenderia fasciculata]|uniref:RelA n=1 Tax=Cavenderia fasciculata TaxID=261658 RepID=F4PTH5_CACFS|nr:RelA [Cavenderia fasciculata]EGG20857.1 RelA [Cavenderia fasciculata]|eukprot:XP_004358707.1 RelA [Cavenderia fasciculata]